MASSLNGIIRIFTDDTYTDRKDEYSRADILDGDAYGYESGDFVCRFVDGIGGSNILDLNDQENYWYLDGSEFPMPEVIYSWVENEESKRLASWHLDSNKITLKLYIRGSSPQDTYDKLRVLLKRLLKENTLEVRMWGADGSVFYHTYPVTPKVPDFAKKYIIDQNSMTDITIEIPVDKEVKTSEQTITITSAHVVGGAALKGVFGINVPPEEIDGDVPAKMDVHIGVVSDRFTDLILGQRKEYSEDFNPVQEPTVGTRVMLATRQSGDYRGVPALIDLVGDGNWSEIASGSGNTTVWSHWEEVRFGGVIIQPIVPGGPGIQVYGIVADEVIGAVFSTAIAVTTSETYRVALRGHRHVAGHGEKSEVNVSFYNGDAFLDVKNLIYSSLDFPTKEYVAYVNPVDFPTGTTHIKISCQFTSAKGYVTSHYWTSITFVECVGGTFEAVFPIEPHRGKAFINVGASFSDTTAYDDLTLQALLQTSEGEEITTSIAPQVISLGDPNTKFKESFLLARNKIQIPSHGVSSNADLTGIEQLVRLTFDWQSAKNFWGDDVSLIYCDGAITEVSGWARKNHLIFDSRSSKSVLVSLDGTLNKAQAYDHSKWKNPPDFEANPDGINMTLLAVKKVAGDHQLNPVVTMSLVYNPTYLLVK